MAAHRNLICFAVTETDLSDPALTAHAFDDLRVMNSTASTLNTATPAVRWKRLAPATWSRGWPPRLTNADWPWRSMSASTISSLAHCGDVTTRIDDADGIFGWRCGTRQHLPMVARLGRMFPARSTGRNWCSGFRLEAATHAVLERSSGMTTRCACPPRPWDKIRACLKGWHGPT